MLAFYVIRHTPPGR